MAATRGDGLGAPHDQPAKTDTKNTLNFIARCRTLPGFAAAVIGVTLVHALVVTLGIDK